jgi:hypothetical protein
MMGRRDGQFTVGIMSYGINLRTLDQPHTSIAFCGEKDQARPRRCHEEHREIPFESAKRMPLTQDSNMPQIPETSSNAAQIEYWNTTAQTGGSGT